MSCHVRKRLGHEFAVAMGDADDINNRIGLQPADDVESEEDCLQRAREMRAAGEPATRIALRTDQT